MSATFRQKLLHDLAAPFRYDGSFNFPLLLVGVASVVHIGWSVATFVAFRRRIDTATMVIVDWDPSVFMMHIRIAIGLLLSVVGLFSRRVIGLFVSTLALVWVGVSGLVLLVDEDQVEGGGRNFPFVSKRFLEALRGFALESCRIGLGDCGFTLGDSAPD